MRRTRFIFLALLLALFGRTLVCRASRTLPNGVSLTYQYDAINRLSVVNDVDGPTAYQYNSAGTIDLITHPNNFYESLSSDSLNRVTGITGTTRISDANYQTVAQFDSGYDAAGNRISANAGRQIGDQWQSASNAYAYNAVYYLTNEAVTLNQQLSTIGYTYDGAGNRLARNSTLPALPSYTYAYDQNDQLTSDRYDKNGNTIAATMQDAQLQPVSCYDAYDHADRLIQRQSFGNSQSATIAFQYDGDGVRVGKNVNGVTTHFLVDDVNPSGYSQVVEEHSLSAGPEVTPYVSRVYTYGNGPLSQDQLINDQWQTSYYGRDTHGSVRYLTDGNGQVTDSYDYDAFGNLINQNGTTPNTRLFSGEEFDADLGMQYLRARYRDPQRGRFWSRDTFEGGLLDPASHHAYNYCENNPVNNVDPSGHEFADDVATMIGPAMANLWVGTMAQVYGLPGTAVGPAAATSTTEAMLIQSTEEANGVLDGQLNYNLTAQGAPFLLGNNDFVAPTPPNQGAPVVIGFDPSMPLYGAGLPNAVMEAGTPNLLGMVAASAGNPPVSGRQGTPNSQRKADLDMEGQGLETVAQQTAVDMAKGSLEKAADMAFEVSLANATADDNRAQTALQLYKGNLIGPAAEPILITVSSYTPAIFQPGADKAPPQTFWEGYLGGSADLANKYVLGAVEGTVHSLVQLPLVAGDVFAMARISLYDKCLTTLNEADPSYELANYHGASELYQGTFDPHNAGPSRGDILLGTANVISLGFIGEGMGLGHGIVTGDYDELGYNSAGMLLGVAGARAMEVAGPAAARMVGSLGNKVKLASAVDDVATVASRTGNGGRSLTIEENNGLAKICKEGNCFVAGTLVATAGGLRPIETIQPNDLVWSYDAQTGQTNLSLVERTYVRQAPETVLLTLDGEAVVCTPEHPFWVAHQGWTLAGNLLPGDSVLTLAGTNAMVEDEVEQPGLITVYNLKVAHDHSYFVSPAGLLVHNADVGYDAAGKADAKGPVNFKGEPVSLPEGHIMSPRDLPFDAPPIIEQGPFTSLQREAMLDGEAGGTKLSPHHRHQVPVRDGSVIDEIPGPGHPAGNQHTAGSPSRHPGPSVFNDMPGNTGKYLRAQEISDHWQSKGERLIEVSPGVWIDPGL